MIIWKTNRVGAGWRKKFAWLPTKMDNGYVIWLEYFKVKQSMGIYNRWRLSFTEKQTGKLDPW